MARPKYYQEMISMKANEDGKIFTSEKVAEAPNQIYKDFEE